MKRTPLRKVSPNKVNKPKKVSKLKKVSKQPISKIQKLLWIECKRIIRARYKHDCYTCDAKNLSGSNLQTGHMIAKASLGAYLKYDLRLLRPQCMLCNIHRGGMGAMFIENMRRIEGDEYVNQILKDRQITIKAYDHYVELLEKYKQVDI
jgi:hypothetical protein